MGAKLPRERCALWVDGGNIPVYGFLTQGVSSRPLPAFIQRSVAKVLRTSSTKISGCSKAAKWPPFSSTLK